MSNDTTTVQTTLPEAPVSATVKVLWRGYDVLYTTRGHTGADVLGGLDKALTWFEDHGGTPTNGYMGTGAGGHASAPAANGDGAYTAGGHEGGVTYTARYVVQPEIKGGKPTGKTILEFWNDDRKFSEHRVTAGPARVTALIGLPEDAQGTLTTFEQPCKVIWTWGKERPNKEDGSPGGRYQDVQRVEMIPPA